MKLIIPMAGRGSRLRPHTLTTPKPLIPIAGKPIVQRLAEDIVQIVDQKVTDIAFIIGDFGTQVEKDLLAIAEKLGAKGSIHYQDKPLGTAHAILCAKEKLDGPVVVAFADTLFRADFKLDTNCDGVIWVKQVEDPRQFGVVQLDDKGVINDFVEKPKNPVSDLAIIGIYYFKDGEYLRRELQKLIDNNITDKGEYQITNALDNMKNQGAKFLPGKVNHWMDCGNKDVTVQTNAQILGFLNGNGQLRGKNITVENSEITEPCFIGNNVVLRNAKVGPGVSLGDGTVVEDAQLQNCIVQENATVKNIRLQNSMIGNHAHVDGSFTTLSIGDYCRME